jgi:hypothetical protein
MEKKTKYIVALHPDAINFFQPFIDNYIMNPTGVFLCASISQENVHFLEIEAIPYSEKLKDVHLSIPYSYVLYIVASNQNLNKVLGFHADVKKSVTRTDS